MSKVKVNEIDKRSGSTLTLGGSGTTVQLGTGATQTGFGRTGTVNWDTTAKTAAFTAVSGNGYFVDTSSSAITVTLPASPSAGDIVAFSDYTRTFQTNNLTIGRNSEKIGGVAADAVLSTEGQTATFVYVDSTEGWINTQETSNSVTGNVSFMSASGGTETTSGDFKIHTFTSPGTFTVNCISNVDSNRNIVSYLVLAGGGGAGDGGGGGGGYRENKSPVDTYTASPIEGSTDITVTAQAYPITVGAGGSAVAADSTSCRAGDGNNSVFSTITSAGGGYGGNGSPGSGNPGVPTSFATGNSGGSGGGSGSPNTPNNTVAGGSGNTPPTTPAQGTDGGDGRWQPGSFGAAGGGGGAGGAGGNYCSGESITGGVGTPSSITGSAVTYAAGGPSATTANSGNGGRGNQTGQSGVVIIRYKFQ